MHCYENCTFLIGFCLNVCSHFKQVSNILLSINKYFTFTWTLVFKNFLPPVCIKTGNTCIMPCSSYFKEALLDSHTE